MVDLQLARAARRGVARRRGLALGFRRAGCAFHQVGVLQQAQPSGQLLRVRTLAALERSGHGLPGRRLHAGRLRRAGTAAELPAHGGPLAARPGAVDHLPRDRLRHRGVLFRGALLLASPGAVLPRLTVPGRLPAAPGAHHRHHVAALRLPDRGQTRQIVAEGILGCQGHGGRGRGPPITARAAAARAEEPGSREPREDLARAEALALRLLLHHADL
mmetsp:Transcript_109548/g.266317  ORF Transcript_109548/g.266317 Transcript_109548/m.266317 type:complete len:217 (+) Transcript_109548:532-1182(+)